MTDTERQAIIAQARDYDEEIRRMEKENGEIRAQLEDAKRGAIIARLEAAGLLPHDGSAIDPAKLDALSDDELDLLALLVLALQVAEAGREAA